MCHKMSTSTKLKSKSKSIASQPVVIGLALVFAAAATWFFLPFLGVICLSALMAFVFFPIFKFLSKYTHRTIAAWTVLGINLLVVAIPILYILILIVQQGIAVANTLSHLDTSSGSQFSHAVSTVNSITATIGLPTDGSFVSGSGLVDFVKVTLPNIVKFGVEAIIAVAANAPVFVTSIIIYSFLFSAFLRYHKEAKQFLQELSPFDKGTTDVYIKNAGIMITASLKGQLVISFVTALLSALLLMFIGFQDYFWLLLVLFTILGMVPLGSGIVVVPICLVSMLVGDFWASFWVLAVYLLVICNLDSLMRPKLIPKEAGIVPALAVLATFCGIYYFGLMGVVYGPLIAILLLTTAHVLIEHKQAKLA